MSTPIQAPEPKKPFSIATSLWDGAKREFGPRTSTTFRSRKEAHSAFLLSQTCIRNGFAKLTNRRKLKGPDVSNPVQWALTRVEFLNRNGARIEAFHLTKSERGLVSRGGTKFQKKEAKATPASKADVAVEVAEQLEVPVVLQGAAEVATPSPALDLSALDQSTLEALQAAIAAKLANA